MEPILAPILDDPETGIEDIVCLTANSGQVEQAAGNEEAWTQMRPEQYRTTKGTHEQ